jgi:hypothetical protein
MFISPRITTHKNLYRNQRFHETDQQQPIYNNSNFLLLKMSQRVVLRNSKPDSFTMLSGTVEKSAQFTSAQSCNRSWLTTLRHARTKTQHFHYFPHIVVRVATFHPTHLHNIFIGSTNEQVLAMPVRTQVAKHF